MNPTDLEARNDLAYLTQLARDDGKVLRASSFGLTAAGVIFGLMMLRTYLIERNWMQWPESLQPFMPADAVVLFLVVLIAGFRAIHSSSGSLRPRANASSRALWAGWAAAGLSYLATQISLSLAGLGPLAVVTLFAFWGGGWLVMWAIYRQPWLLVVAAGCYVTTALTGLLWNSPEASLVLALGFFALLAVPGYLVQRHSHWFD